MAHMSMLYMKFSDYRAISEFYVRITDLEEYPMPQWLLFVIIGLLGGVSSGLFGIGGGIVIVPALIFWAGFSQHQAVGTSLAVLLPPVGLAAVLEFYRHGNVKFQAAMVLAIAMFAGAWGGAMIANLLKSEYLRLIFGVFVSSIGIYIIYGSCKQLAWF